MSEIEAEAEARWGTHVAALIGVFLVGISWPAVIALAICVITGMLGVTLAYHRYFAHRSFNTSRWFQFFLALWGATSLQRGPIWWAAVHRHRHHHRHPDTEDDWHTPLHGFWHAHNGWLESPHILDVSYDRVPDLTRYPEMRFIDTFYHIPALLMIATLAAIGSYLQAHYPALGTSAWQMVVWGFFVRTVRQTRCCTCGDHGASIRMTIAATPMCSASSISATAFTTITTATRCRLATDSTGGNSTSLTI
jgi:stearoyl-CoA desaturase (delta-9 desaturase)